MSVAKVTEITSGSPEGFEHAIKLGIERASKSLNHIKSAWVKEQSVVVGETGAVKEFRVAMKVTFVLE